MILTTDLRDWIVIPTLRFMEPEVPYTKAAVRLMLGTIAQESSGGMWLDQGTLGAGPAYGIAQMEEPTYYDHCTWMAAFNKALFEKFCELVPHSSMVRGAARMRGDLMFAVFMMRVHYYRVVAGLPTTLQQQAAYWKKYYNTIAGSGTVTQYLINYNQVVGSAGEF